MYCNQYARKSGKLSSGHRTGKVSFHSYPKTYSNYHTIALISHVRKVMLKILQARLQQYMSWELPDVQAGFRKGRGSRHQTANLLDHKKSKRIPEKYLFLLHWLAKAFDCVDHHKLWNILKEMRIPDHLTCLLDCVDHHKLWNILKEMGIPDHLTCLLLNLYAGQEATVRTGHGTTDWFQIGKGVC